MPKKFINFPTRSYRQSSSRSQLVMGDNPEGVGGPRINQRDILPGSITPRHLDRLTQIATIQYNVDGGGVSISTGEKGYVRVEFDCVILRATLLADTGTATFDIWKIDFDHLPATNAHSITGSTPLAIIANAKYVNTTLHDWTIRIKAGDILAFNADAVSGATRCSITLKVKKT